MNVRLKLIIALLVFASACFAGVTELGQAKVGSSSNGEVTIALTSGQLANGPTFAMHYGIDFSAGNCVPVQGGCQLAVTFAPKSPGSRSDAVIVKDSSGAVITKAFVHGTGQGPLAVFSPGMVSVRYSAQLNPLGNTILGMAVDAKGTAYFAVSGQGAQATLLKVDPNSSSPKVVVNAGVFGYIESLAVDAAGDIFLLSGGLQELDGETLAVTTVSLDTLQTASAIATDMVGNVYVLDETSVHRVDAVTKAITLVAGSSTGTSNGDGGPAVDAVLNSPQAITLDSAGNLYISEGFGDIRKVDATTQIINTIAGTGVSGYSGDGGPALAAQIGDVTALTTDGLGNLYLADLTSYVIRKIDAATQIITTVAGNSSGFSPETGMLANQVQLSLFTKGLGVDANGNLFAGILYNGVYEIVGSAPTLPFLAPGSGPDPSLTESIGNAGNLPLSLTGVAIAGPYTLQTSASNPCVLPVTLSSEGSCELTIAYNGSSTQAGTLTITDNAGNAAGSTQQAGLNLIYPVDTLSATSFNFGPVTVGSWATQFFNIYNTSNASLLFQNITVTGANPNDFVVNQPGSDCPASLEPEANCELYVIYTPSGAGPRSASLVLSTNALDSPVKIALSGTGVPAGVLTASSSSLNFTVASLGATSAPETITFTNTGGSVVGLTFPPSAVGQNLTVTSDTCAVPSLAVGASCSLTIQATATSPLVTGEIYANWNGSLVVNTMQIPVTTTVTATGGSLLYVPVTPCRVADTRTAASDFGGPAISAGTTRTFLIPNSACNIPATAAAYSLNVTAVPNGPLKYMTVWPAGQSMPNVSTLNSDGRVKANAAIVPAGTNAGISIYATNTSNAIVDIDGYFVPSSSSGLAFYPVTPCRIADTRTANGSLGGPSLAAGVSRQFPVPASNCGIPSAAQAYSLNFTAIPSSPLSYLTVWPAGTSQPVASTLNATIPDVTANAAIVPAGANGAISVFATSKTDLVIDVNGYFAPPGNGGLSLYTVTPCRALDTRSSGTKQPFTGTMNVNLSTSACAVPAAAKSYVLNATALPDSALEYLTLWPQGEPQPTVSTLNSSGDIVSNMAIVSGNQGSISAFATQYTNLLLDVSGYFAP